LDPRIEIPTRNVAAELALAEELTVDPGLAQVLYARGIRDADAAQRFLLPDAASLTPPSDFPDVDEAAGLILEGVRDGKVFFVAGDYDVDGLAATALLVIVLRRLGATVRYYIPDRLSEGYDLSAATVARAIDGGAAVLITADCGRPADDALAEARRAGLAVVVTDHHRLGETLPPADAVITPQRLAEGHPARGFAGVGVAYKLAEEVLRRSDVAFEPASLLPLVAVGTVCDVVGLTGENRVLVAAGLKGFPGELFTGLAALLAESRVEAPVTSWHLAFVVGPRLNAAGRLGHAAYALELLLAEEEGRARALAGKLEDFNKRRRALEEEVTAEAMEKGAAQVTSGRRSVVLWGKGWHPGVVGIVASRVVERFYRPAVLIAVQGGAGRGSCRSVPAFDVHDALAALEEYLIRFGGHRLAAGFEIEERDIPAFAEAFEFYAAERLDDEALRAEVRVDGYLPLQAVNTALAGDLRLLEPVGQDNPAATFYTRARVAAEAQRVFKNAHLEIIAAAGPAKFRAIGFNLARDGEMLESGEYGLVHTPTLDTWRDRERVELRLEYILPVRPGGRKEEPARIVDERGRRRPGGERTCEKDSDIVFGFPPPEDRVSGCEFVEYAGTVDAERRYRRVWVAAPPFDAHRLSMLLGGADEVVLAYGDDEAREARGFLRRYYPDRETLAALYRELRERGYSPSENDDLALRRALGVFRELGLIEDVGEGATVIDDGWLTSAARKALDESPLFRRCQRRREEAERFVAAMCEWPAPALEDLARDLSFAGWP
jgi:single-stranded-DNA-specific exonuclease